MRITFIAFGTRGDVQPVIALGQALKANGHAVRLIAGANFKPWIESHGLEAAAATVDVQAVMESEGGLDWVEHGNNPIRQMQVMKKLFDQSGWAMMLDTWNACRDAQAVVSSQLTDIYAVSIAERLKARHISLALQPSFTATRSGAATLLAPAPDRESQLNYLFGKVLLETVPWQIFGGALASRFRRQELGLPPQTREQNIAARKKALVLHGYSRHVAPHPADWPSTFHTTGYWFLDEADRWQPPHELAQFVESGPPPVCIGFGSMTGRNIEKITRLVVEAVTRSGQRAVLLSGWSGMGEAALPASIFRLEAAPHRWLYPRMAAVVHHGGAGTVAAGLCAGAPTVVVPHMADQPFWGQRVEALGVGPKAIPRPRLTGRNLGEAIRRVATDPAMKNRTAELGRKIRSEDGVGRAVKLIETYLKGD